MKERPIIFSGPMVRALLENRKSQTRRIVKNRKHPDFGCDIAPGELAREQQHVIERSCPYGQHGDRLWVKETFCPIHVQGLSHLPIIEVDYRATYEQGHRLGDLVGIKKIWKPSIFMPRALSRILLEITGVRVERLQNISEEDARTEGVTLPERTCTMYDGIWRDGYRVLWESINGAGSWNASPFCWVLEFRRIEP